MKRDIHLEFTYPYAPELVWDALTDPAAIAEWLMENDFEPVVGREFQFRTKPAPGFDGIVRCKVLTVDRPRCLSYSWHGGGHQTVATFHLVPEGKGTRLRLEHTGFTGLGGVLTSFMLGMGWKKKLLRERLPPVLDRLAARRRDA